LKLEKYRALFLEEAADHLAEMGRALVALEKEPGTDEAVEGVDTVFRMAHSTKSMAASLGYGAITELSHRLEDWMTPLRGGGNLPENAVPLLFEVIGGLEEMLAAVSGSIDPEPRPDLLRLLESPAVVPTGFARENRRKKA
jgi:two-component system chemotaxis sensor kinase CheA